MRAFKAVLPALLFVVTCVEPQHPSEFAEAFAALDKTLTKERLESSAFAPRFPQPTAKQVVSYLLSQAGAEILQVSGSPFGENIDYLSHIPVWPPGVTLWHSSRQIHGEHQVILTWDNENRIVIANAYKGNNPEPVYVREWKVVPLTPKNPIDTSDTREFQAF